MIFQMATRDDIETPRMPPLLDDRLGYLLAVNHGGMRALGEPRLIAELGIGVKSYGVMTALAGLDVPPSQQELCAMLRVDRTTMVITIDALERAGFVARRRNPDDRREQLLELTPAGERARQRGDRIVTEVERKFLAPLSAAERKELKRMLRACATRHGRVPHT